MESSQVRDQTHISCVSCIGRWILYHWATREAQQGFFKKYKVFFTPLLTLLEYCVCIMFGMFCFFFGHKACGILAAWPRMEPAHPFPWKAMS